MIRDYCQSNRHLLGLFPPAIFKSLLFKATNTARLGSSPAGDEPQTSREHSDSLFSRAKQGGGRCTRASSVS